MATHCGTLIYIYVLYYIILTFHLQSKYNPTYFKATHLQKHAPPQKNKQTNKTILFHISSIKQDRN